jgi:hypothetical protein
MMMVVLNTRMQTQHLYKAKIQDGIDKKASKEYTRRQYTKYYNYTTYNVIGPDPRIGCSTVLHSVGNVISFVMSLRMHTASI